MSHEINSAEMTAAVDNCSKEPVHIPGCIQAFGAMLVCEEKTLEITDASENISQFIGLSLAEIIGSTIDDVLGSLLAERLQTVKQNAAIARRHETLGSQLFGKRLLSFHVFSSGPSLIIELEPVAGLTDISHVQDTASHMKRLVDRLSYQQTRDDLLDTTVECFRDLTKYDRVVIVRFDEQNNGEVLAESRVPDIEGMLGLRFPEYDIPAQARSIMRDIPLSRMALT